jgi:hypothetical protein
VVPSLSFSIELAGIGVSLINRKLIEVVYLSVDTLKFEYSNSTVAQTVNVACGTLQIDNQLHEALYPVILQPTPIAKQSNSVAALPTVQGSVIWLKDQGELVDYTPLLTRINFLRRAWCFLHQILLHTASSPDNRNGRRFTLRTL